MTQIYKLHIEYGEMGHVLWRDMEVSGNYRLNMLGYAILATFDTCAYHLFEFQVGDTRFVIPEEGFLAPRCIDMAEFKLSDLELRVGETIAMDYDYGTTQTFRITVVNISEMPKGMGRSYPKITDGRGRGILDDYSEDEFAELVRQIEKSGKTDEEIYYKDEDEDKPWNINDYNIKCDNMLLKREIALIEDGFSECWM